MNHLLNLIKKELKELLTPGTVVTMVVMAMIFVGMGAMISEQSDQAGSDVAGMKFGYFNGDSLSGDDSYSTDNLVALGGTELVSEDVSSPETILNTLNEKGLGFIIVIDPDFSENVDSAQQGKLKVYYNQKGLSMFDSTSSAVASIILTEFDKLVSNDYLVKNGVTDTDFVRAPTEIDGRSTFLNGEVYEGVTPEQIVNAVSMQQIFIPIIMMLVIIMIGSILISSMGNEKENKTLETLLTMPVKRTTVVAGKIIGSAIAGLLFALVYMFGMYYYMNSITGTALSGGISLSDIGLALSTFDWVIVTVFMFLSIICALGLCMLLGAFVKDYRAAQLYVMPISILAIIPMVLTVFSDFQSMSPVLQAVVFLIPFSHPMMIMNSLLMDQTLLVAGGLVYMVAFALLSIYVTVRIYNSDILLSGWSKMNKLKKGLGKK